MASSAIVATSCTQKAESTTKLGVIVTILPQAEFVESVGGDKVDVTVMVPPGASPHTYEPTPGQMEELSRAKMYAEVGSGVDVSTGNNVGNSSRSRGPKQQQVTAARTTITTSITANRFTFLP